MFRLAYHITPARLLGALALSFVLWLLVLGGEKNGVLSFSDRSFGYGAGVAFSLLACGLCLMIAAEHRGARLMQWCWWLLAANAGLSAVRYTLEAGRAWMPFADGSQAGLLLQAIIFPANLCLLGGCVMMWWAFRSVGLHVRLSRTDWGLIALTLLLTGFIYFFRTGYSEGGFAVFSLARYSQYIGTPIFTCYGVFSIVLYRMTEEMGSSHLTRAVRCLIFYMLLRAGTLVINNGNIVLHREYGWANYSWLVTPINEAVWLVVRSLPALMAAHRLQMSVQAQHRLREIRRKQAQVTAAPAMTE